MKLLPKVKSHYVIHNLIRYAPGNSNIKSQIEKKDGNVNVFIDNILIVGFTLYFALRSRDFVEYWNPAAGISKLDESNDYSVYQISMVNFLRSTFSSPR